MRETRGRERVVGKEREGGEKEEKERQGRVEMDSEEEEAEVDKGDKLTINDSSRS